MLRVTTTTLLGPLSLGLQKKPELARLPSKPKVMGSISPSPISDLSTYDVPATCQTRRTGHRSDLQGSLDPEGIQIPGLDDTGGDKALEGDKPGESS